MSRFQKLLIAVIFLAIILYMFNFSAQANHKKTLNEKEVVKYVLQEYDYEIKFNDCKVKTDEFVNQAVLQAAQNKHFYENRP